MLAPQLPVQILPHLGALKRASPVSAEPTRAAQPPLLSRKSAREGTLRDIHHATFLPYSYGKGKRGF